LKTKFLILFFTIYVTLCFSQKESANWYFGNFAGLNFNSGAPVPLLNGQLITKEGCASISDINGNLLFYTDGITVWNRRHQIMPNGEGLLGHVSTTESALIVPKPGSRLSYYIFTVDRPSYFQSPLDPIDGVNFTEVDLSLNNGFGDVIVSSKNIHLITYDINDSEQKEFKSSEKITAVSHNDGSSVWVITQFKNKFYAFKVDSNGVNQTPIISKTTENVQVLLNSDHSNISAIGYLKISPNGKKIAIAHSSTSLGSPRSGRKQSGKVLLYDFNNATGLVSNEKLVVNNDYPYGIEFSPNSKLLYVTVSEFNSVDVFVKSYLQQYNLENSNAASSLKIISDSRNVAGALQLAMDGKIYRAGYESFKKGSAISVINKPNALGSTCNYSHNTVNLGGPDAQIGLPIFVQSIFLASFEFEDTCLGDQTHFHITSEEPFETAIWDFGDGQTTTEEEPYHTYSQSGVYKVSLTLTINGIDLEPFIKEVIITQPIQVLQTTFDLIQCDSFDNDPNDGKAVFNLQSANAPLTLNTNEAIQAYYYHSIIDAVNDVNNTMALNNIYTNQSQNEMVYAKIFKTNTDCYNIASLRLITTQPVDLSSIDLNACTPVGTLIGDFDLESKGQEIIANLNLPSNVTIQFYETENDAAIGMDALPNMYNSGEKRIYVRAESDNACYGIGTLDLYLKPFPQINDQVIHVCSAGFPIKIETGLSSVQIANYNFYWNTNETTNEIFISQEGIYSVTVDDPNFRCSNTIYIDVKQNRIPEIQDLVIDGHGITVLLTRSEESFLYAVDDENGVYQESNTFLNLQEGLHTVFVKDINNCEIISQSFYIFGFPKYFTPNADGQNDTWNAYGLNSNDFQQVITIQIFDRYGKLLKVFDPLNTSGWNGMFNGQLVTPDDYWYFMKLPNGKEYRGHFTLKI
jgi:gliding motility-associated-like protein